MSEHESDGGNQGDAGDDARLSVRRRLSFGEVPSSSNTAGEGDIGPRAEASNDCFNEMLRELAPELRERLCNVAREFREDYTSSPRFYIADVFLPSTVESGERAISYMSEYGASRRYGFFGYSAEGDHIHVIHDCSYNQRMCRCRFREVMQQYGSFKRHERFVRATATIDEISWQRIFAYYFLSKQGKKEVFYQNLRSRVPTNDEFIQDGKLIRERAEKFRKESTIWPFTVSDRRVKRSAGGPEQSDVASEEGLSEEESKSRYHGKKSKRVPIWDTIRAEVYRLLAKYHPAPLQTVRSLEEFKQASILTNPKNEAYINKSIQLYSDNLINASLRDFYTILLNCEQPMYFKGVIYGNVEESTDIINQLLMHQFNGDEDRVTEFLNTLVLILDKKIPKCNCFVVKSPPSAGKNFFFDMICAIFVNYGQLGQVNRHNLFGFQDAPNKRILIWNEPNYESSMTDTIKMMMAGDPYNVNVKHSQQQPVTKTPVIVMTNSSVGFMNDLSFKDRIRKYEWTSAPFLKNIKFKPNPMSFFHILNKYNIDY